MDASVLAADSQSGHVEQRQDVLWSANSQTSRHGLYRDRPGEWIRAARERQLPLWWWERFSCGHQIQKMQQS